MASITCGNCKLTHDSVEQVRSCYAIQNQDPASVTPSQARAMHHSHASNPIASKLINQAAERRGGPRFTIEDDDLRASLNAVVQEKFVEGFKAGVRFAPSPEPLFEDEPDEQGNPTVVYIPVTEPGESTRNKAGQTKPGFYKVGEDVFKVTPTRTSDRTFAHKLITGIQPERGDFGWEYLGLGRRYVPEFADKLTLAEAKTFGHTHGYCLICGRLLTAEQSVADGIGPICAGKL